MRSQPYISFFIFTDSRDRLISQPVLSATEDGFILFIVQIDLIDNLTGSYPDVIVRVDCEAVVAVLFAAGKYRCELLVSRSILTLPHWVRNIRYYLSISAFD